MDNINNDIYSAVDNHNIANGDESWFSRKVNATGELISDIGEGITKGGVGAVVAGVNSFVNSGIAVANFLGADIGEVSTYDTLAGIDSSLSDYYAAHQSGIETAGFVIGAFAPGTAGIKMMQAARAGYMGSNVAKSAGLMGSLTADYTKLAKAEIASGAMPFSILNGNTVKSLAQGLGSQTVDAAAFNIMVTATMFKSPVLDQQSAGDLVIENIKDTIFGGVVGGLLKGIGTYSAIKKAGKASDELTAPYRIISDLGKKIDEGGDITPAEKILIYKETQFRLPEAMGPVGYNAEKVGLNEGEQLALITKTREETITKLDGLIQRSVNDFSGGDTAIGNQLHEALKGSENFGQVFAAVGNSKGASRIGVHEQVAHGDTLFLNHKLTNEDFDALMKGGEFDKLLTPNAGKGASGYSVTGNLGELRIARSGAANRDSKDAAWNAGYDVFRNQNGSFSVNPESKILKSSNLKREANNFIVDLENGGAIRDKAIPGLADLASIDRPIVVKGDTILAGDMNPIKVGKSISYDPTQGNYLEAQARHIWAQKANIKWDGLVIGEKDLPLLERFLAENPKLSNDLLTPSEAVFIRGADGKAVRAPTGEALKNYIATKKTEMAVAMDGKDVSEIALRLNVPEKWLAGEDSNFIKMTAETNYNLPRYAKITTNEDLSRYPSLNPNNHDAMIEWGIQKQNIVERHKQTFSNYAGADSNNFLDDLNWSDPGRAPTREGAGASMMGFANANAGTPGGWAQYQGFQSTNLKLKVKTANAELLNNSWAPVQMAGREAIAEVGLVLNRLRMEGGGWKLHPTDPMMLVPRGDWDKIAKSGMQAENSIPFKSSEARDFWVAHQEEAARRQVHVANMKGAAGVGDDFDPAVFYPPPIDTAKLKHFVIVEPRAPASLSDKKRVISAKSEEQLTKMVAEVDQDQFKVWTKAEKEEWHKNVGDYDFALGMNDSMVDSALKREGKLSQHFPSTNESVFDEFVNWHQRQEEMLANSMIYHRYAQSFTELEHLGQRYTNTATSQFRSLTKKLEEGVKDPYNDIIKTALGISRASEYQPWTNFNTFIRDTIEKPINKLRDIFSKDPKIDDAFVDQVNQITKDQGLGPVFKNTAQVLLANKNIPDSPWLQNFVAKTNAVLSTTLLQWDFINPINNMASVGILAAPEMKAFLKGIESKDASVAGKLKDMLSVKAPDGSGIELPTTARIMHQAAAALVTNNAETSAVVDRLARIGATSTLMQEMRQSLDSLTLNYNVAKQSDATKGLEALAEFGRKYTGNNWAEQKTRFFSGYAMYAVTDPAVKAGLITEREANEFILNYVNRTQGNYLYSQRPIVFQGVVGQAVGLFQTYQFNLMQQLFKHVANGDSKSTALLLGMQGSIYGTQGLPAFNFVNTHIVGNASGNTNHTDLYNASYSVFGKSLGDWMLYGLGSNALSIVDPSMRVNLYSRGDINPRQLTVLPTSLSDIPIVSAATKFLGSVFGAAQKIGNGADILPSLSQAIEHNGLSRPLSGLAQIAQGYSTTNSGSLLSASQDFYNVATLSRIAGGKPFDEALALDQTYRINAYRSHDLKEINELGAAIKTTTVAGGHPSSEQITQFAADYVKSGGRIEGFNKFFTNLQMQSNQSQVNRVAQNLNSPFAKQLQTVMGGVPLPDFVNTPVKE